MVASMAVKKAPVWVVAMEPTAVEVTELMKDEWMVSWMALEMVFWKGCRKVVSWAVEMGPRTEVKRGLK